MPTSRQSQLTIESLMELMNETAKGNLDLITEKLPSPESISFPNPFTEREEEFLKEAMEFYQANNPFVKEKKYIAQELCETFALLNCLEIG